LVNDCTLPLFFFTFILGYVHIYVESILGERTSTDGGLGRYGGMADSDDDESSEGEVPDGWGEKSDDDDDDDSDDDYNVEDEIMEKFIRSFHNGDYDAEFDDSYIPTKL
jgi:hypothetical protein